MAFCVPLALPGAPASFRSHVSVARCSAGARSGEDLVVVGAGALGMRVARAWRKRHPNSTVVCATASESRHDEIATAGFVPALASQLRDPAARVVFCAPPSGLDGTQYAKCVRDAAQIAVERFVFTSATSVFADAEVVTEDSPLSDSARAGRLLEAERAAEENGNGVVLRLGGLYSLERGPHSAWLRRGEVGGGPDGMLNMVHYDDVTEAAVRALEGEREVVVGRRFLVVDGEPVTRREVLEAALRHPMYKQFEMPKFGEGGHKKRINGSWSAQMLKWTPKYKSFVQFMQEESALVEAGTVS